jgi:hypothetical protein
MKIVTLTAALALMTGAATIPTAQAATSPDIVGIYAVLATYMQNCIPREDPAPLAQMVELAHVAQMLGVDFTKDSFKREAATRAKNLTFTLPLVGSRQWCEISGAQVDTDYEALKTFAAGKANNKGR